MKKLSFKRLFRNCYLCIIALALVIGVNGCGSTNSTTATNDTSKTTSLQSNDNNNSVNQSNSKDNQQVNQSNQVNTQNSDGDENRIVYYVPGSKVYHLSKDDGTLKKSKTILTMTLKEAKEKGMRKSKARSDE